MSLEAIEQIMETERLNRTRRLAAEEEARKILADAERSGQVLLENARAAAVAQGDALLAQAEKRAAARCDAIAAEAEAECVHRHRLAEERMAETAAFIAERVVKH